MVKYLAVALVLKFFSLNNSTKKLYRYIGNKFGAKKRINAGLRKKRIDRAKLILELLEKHNVVCDGQHLLELGTGWMQWESTIIRLFNNVNITLFDVWDNRQLDAFQGLFSEFEKVIDNELEIPKDKNYEVHRILKSITKASSFEEIYKEFNFRYFINHEGKLTAFSENSMDMVFSYNVLEHVNRSIISNYIEELNKILKPGGYSIHVIDITDHLANYDPGVSRKQYLKYSDSVWKAFFENDVQYINRIQKNEWLNIFDESGLELVEEVSVKKPLKIRPHELYRKNNGSDLECCQLRVVHRKKSGG